MSVSSNYQFNNFINNFCSMPLEINGILAFNDNLAPCDLYERLVEYRDKYAHSYMNTDQLYICEKNLKKLAANCHLKHQSFRAKLQKTEERECFPTRIFNWIFGKQTRRHSHLSDTRARLSLEEPREVLPAKREAISNLIKILCFDLPLEKMFKLAPSVEKLSRFQSDETSPHVLYEQLVEIRDRYFDEVGIHAVDSEHFLKIEENLAKLAWVCCETHTNYVDMSL